MDAVTIGILGREYANAALAKARAGALKEEALRSLNQAIEVEQRAQRALMDAIKSHVGGNFSG